MTNAYEMFLGSMLNEFKDNDRDGVEHSRCVSAGFFLTVFGHAIKSLFRSLACDASCPVHVCVFFVVGS